MRILNPYSCIYAVAVVCILCSIFCACNSSVEQKDNPSAIYNKPSATHETLETYKRYLAALDSTNVNTVTLATQKYKELFSGNSDTLRNDTAYSMFERYYYKVGVEQDTDQIFTELLSDIDNPDLDSPAKYSAALAKPYADLKANGFRLQEEYDDGERFIVALPDRSFIFRNFFPFVSEAMRKYQDQLRKENQPGRSSFSEEEFADGLIWWGRYVDENAGFVLIRKAKRNYRVWLSTIMFGLESKNKKEQIFSKNVYSNIQLKHPHSKSAEILRSYFEALQAADKHKVEEYKKEYSVSLDEILGRE